MYEIDFQSYGLPAWLDLLPTLSVTGLTLAIVFMAMSWFRGQEDMKFLAVSAAAYAMVPLLPMLGLI